MSFYRVAVAISVFSGIFPLAGVPSAHASIDLITDGEFQAFSGTAPSSGTSTALKANTLSDWVNGKQITGTPSYTGGVGYNFVYTQNGSHNYNYSSGDLPLWNTSNSGLNSIGLPVTGYAGNIIGADGAYQTGPISQTISGLTSGHQYDVSFYYAGAQQQGFTGDTTEAWDVSLGGSGYKETTVLNNVSHGFTGWHQATIAFTADSSSDVLSFLALGTPTGVPPFTMLADVSMQEVPEASTVFAGAFLLLPVGFFIRRMLRQSKAA